VLLLAAVCLAIGAFANPAIEKEFHRVVDSNQCLKSCMLPVQQSNVELSVFKRSNFTDYLLNLDSICQLIGTARECIDACGIASNPFALRSMIAVCSAEVRTDVQSLSECLNNEGASVHGECVEACGDFEGLNEQIRLRTTAMKPEDKAAAAELMRMSNDACRVQKCEARCQESLLNERCVGVENGQRAGALLRSLVERVLQAQRLDLEQHGLLDAMAENTAPQCNFLYTPEALFNPIKDLMSQRAQHKATSPAGDKKEGEFNLLAALKRDAERKISYTAGQLHVQVLEKQLDVLAKQSRNLDREFEKTNFEIARLFQKQSQPVYQQMF